MKNISKKISLSALFLFLSFSIFAQNNKEAAKPEHRIIFQLATGDTTAHKQLIKSLNNILTVSPTTQIEIVCQGAALDMLTADKSVVQEKIKALTEKGVVFNACEFAMKERKLDRARMIPSAGFVPAGVIEIVSKQEQGWSYIRSGN